MSDGQGELRDALQRIREKNKRLEVLRDQVARKDKEIANLRSLLSSSRASVPMFFLTGRAKSGTSWLMRLLNSHPEVLCRGEGRIVGRNYRRPDVKRMDTKTFQPSSLRRALLESEYLNLWVERSVWTRNEDKEEQFSGLTEAAARYFMEKMLLKEGKRIVGDKTPFLDTETISEIGEIFPEAKVIHIVRDGRDVAVSAMHHLWNNPVDLGGRQDLTDEEVASRDAYREDPEGALKTGIFTEERIRKLARGWRSQVRRARRDGSRIIGENYIEVRYEEMLKDPLSEFAKLFAFLGADSEQSIVEACVEGASFEQWSGGRKPGQEDSEVLLRKGIVGDWKNVFTDRDRRIFKKNAGDLLIELGYESDENW